MNFFQNLRDRFMVEIPDNIAATEADQTNPISNSVHSAQTAQTQERPLMTSPSSKALPAPSMSKYSALRTVATIAQLVGWLNVFACIAGIMMLLGGDWLFGLSLIFAGLVSGLIAFAIGEILLVFMDIAIHTGHSNAKLHEIGILLSASTTKAEKTTDTEKEYVDVI